MTEPNDERQRYTTRQTQLMQQHQDWLFLLGGTHEQKASQLDQPAKADPQVLYLTGCDDPSAILALGPDPGPKGFRAVLFVPETDTQFDRFHGRRPELSELAVSVAVDEVRLATNLIETIKPLLRDTRVIGYRLGRDQRVDRQLLDALEHQSQSKPRTGRGLLPIHDPYAALGELRLFKDPDERRKLREAGRLSAQALQALMGLVKPGMSERQVATQFVLELNRLGSLRTPYPPIVATGERALTLHAAASARRLQSGELLLVDAAGECEHYGSDLSRSFPVGPQFSTPQAQLYEVVLAAQQTGIEQLRPGQSIEAVHLAARQVLAEGLKTLGVSGLDETLLDDLFPHQTSHWLGLEAHDAGRYRRGGRSRRLEAHMALSVEPGLYLPVDDERVPEQLRGLGIRIEDTVLITEQGAEVLTADAPKEIEQIEQLRAEAYR
jgi:Xaa-Pro aminopeptidase